MDLLWKGFLGGLLTVLISWASKRGNVLPGILPLFPTFDIIALYVVGTKNEAGVFQATALAGIKTLPAYLVFLGVCHFSAQEYAFKIALLLGGLAWFAVAGLLFLLPKTA